MACGVLCGGGVFAGRGEGFGESVCLLAGFGGLGLGGDGGGLGAAAGGFGVGDLGADTSGVQAGGLLAGSADQDGGLADQGVERGERVLVAGDRAGCGGGDARVVMETLGAVAAAEDPVPASALSWQRAPAAGTLADHGAAGGIVVAVGGLAGHRQCLPAGSGRGAFSFHFSSEVK